MKIADARRDFQVNSLRSSLASKRTKLDLRLFEKEVRRIYYRYTLEFRLEEYNDSTRERSKPFHLNTFDLLFTLGKKYDLKFSMKQPYIDCNSHSKEEKMLMLGNSRIWVMFIRAICWLNMNTENILEVFQFCLRNYNVDQLFLFEEFLILFSSREDVCLLSISELPEEFVRIYRKYKHELVGLCETDVNIEESEKPEETDPVVNISVDERIFNEESLAHLDNSLKVIVNPHEIENDYQSDSNCNDLNTSKKTNNDTETPSCKNDSRRRKTLDNSKRKEPNEDQIMTFSKYIKNTKPSDEELDSCKVNMNSMLNEELPNYKEEQENEMTSRNRQENTTESVNFTFVSDSETQEIVILDGSILEKYEERLPEGVTEEVTLNYDFKQEDLEVVYSDYNDNGNFAVFRILDDGLKASLFQSDFLMSPLKIFSDLSQTAKLQIAQDIKEIRRYYNCAYVPFNTGLFSLAAQNMEDSG